VVAGAAPAGATSGAMRYGATNAAGTSGTKLTSSSSSEALRVVNSGLGHGIVGAATHTSAIAYGVSGTGVNGAGVSGATRGAGPAIRAVVEPGARGSALVATTKEPDNAEPTIRAVQRGSGHGVYALIEQTANANRALYARTAGTGHAVLAVSTNSSSVAATIKATTAGPGAAVECTSALGAPLLLTPSSASTHPARGRAGELFVDGAKRLWFCKGGVDWHQLV
jgi:hypothetical protein